MITLRNPAAGETMRIRPLTTDDVLRADLEVAAVHHGPPAHRHLRATERFTVVRGALRVRLGRRWQVLPEGSTVVVPPGVVHSYAGVPGTTATVRVELDPAGRMAEFFEALYGLPADQRVRTTGAPRAGAGLALLAEHRDDITLPLPRPLARLLLAAAR